jgi:hypothetical protein
MLCWLSFTTEKENFIFHLNRCCINDIRWQIFQLSYFKRRFNFFWGLTIKFNFVNRLIAFIFPILTIKASGHENAILFGFFIKILNAGCFLAVQKWLHAINR